MNVAFAKLEVPTSGAIVAGVFADNKLTPSASKLDRQTRGAVSRAIAASRFKGRAEDMLMINAPGGTKDVSSTVVVSGQAGHQRRGAAKSAANRKSAPARKKK